MLIIGCLVVRVVGASLYRWFSYRNLEVSTSLMCEFYGCSGDEILGNVWPNGWRWLRSDDIPRPETGSANTALDWSPAFWAASPYDTLALSLTTDGVFILVDNRRHNNIGILRFSPQDIQAVMRLSSESELAVSRLGRKETAVPVALYLKTGESYWIQMPESAHQALTQPELSDKS